MKKNGLLMLITLALISLLVVGCNSEVESTSKTKNSQELVYATFGGSGSKDLSVSYSFIDYTQLYWLYQSDKKDTLGTAGETNIGPTCEYKKVPGDSVNGRGLDGIVGPFSQGDWEFKLYGYETEGTYTDSSQVPEGAIKVPSTETTGKYYTGLVYSGSSAEKVSLKYGAANAIPVNVAPSGETGKISLDGLNYTWNSEMSSSGTADLTLRITVTPATSNAQGWTYNKNLSHASSYNLGSTDYVLNSNTEPTSDIPVGNYSLKFTVIGVGDNATEYELASQTLSLAVFGSQTTRVSGNLTEALFVTNAYFVATDSAAIVKVTTDGENQFKTDKTAKGVVTDGTIVTIPSGTLTTGSQSNLVIDLVSIDIAQEVASENSFEVSEGNVAVAALSITLTEVTTTTSSLSGDTTVTETEITDFTSAVTVSTYIEPGLTGVNVHYNGEKSQPSNVSYNSETGLLTFETTHFSDFYVTSTCVAKNETTGKYYSSLADAFDKSVSGQTIKLISNITIDLSAFNASNLSTSDYHYYALSFDGVFDGDGHKITITNTTSINTEDFDKDTKVFRILEEASGTLKSFTVVNNTGSVVSIIRGADDSSAADAIYSLSFENVSYGEQGENSTIKMKVNNAGLFTQTKVGHLSFKNCKNYYNITSEAGYTGIFVGGRVSASQPDKIILKFENCENYGDINATKFGILIGNENNNRNTNNTVITGCMNAGDLIATTGIGFVCNGGNGSILDSNWNCSVSSTIVNDGTQLTKDANGNLKITKGSNSVDKYVLSFHEYLHYKNANNDGLAVSFRLRIEFNTADIINAQTGTVVDSGYNAPTYIPLSKYNELPVKAEINENDWIVDASTYGSKYCYKEFTNQYSSTSSYIVIDVSEDYVNYIKSENGLSGDYEFYVGTGVAGATLFGYHDNSLVAFSNQQ